MKDSFTSKSQNSSAASVPRDMGFSPWQRLKTKRISYLTLPLLAMATVVEFVILATGWKYQKVVCLPQGMGVTFFGIGPIGATILACELLKLPLAIWTASRHGWQKGIMICFGLPLICVLTFQLVKDMAVYEMGVAMTPPTQMLEKATEEEIKINQLNGELAAIEQKKGDRERKVAELAAKRAKAKADLEESLKRTEEAKQDAINLTDYQNKELSEVEARQATIIQQFNADTEQINKAIAELRTRRELEVGRATEWNAAEARIENAYKTKLADYSNRKAQYDKDKAEYDGANFIKRQLLKEPVSPGVPPERESNSVLKPASIADIDAQIKAKEAELLNVSNKRRDRVAQVDADARRLREEYDKRSSARREKSDDKREQLAAAQAAVAAQLDSEEKAVDLELTSAVKKVDGIRADIDAARKVAQGYYEAREAAIRKTQVHRIATTVEIVRGLIKGERPTSIKATAKERGDLLTDQISMVRIWVYPVLAFIVAFLPTLMVEIGFSTVFQPEKQRPNHRLGFFGRRLHWLYMRAGKQKILRAERLAGEASAAIASRDRALASSNAAAEQALAEKDAELQVIRDALSAATAQHEAEFGQREQEFSEQLKSKEAEWVAKLAATADSLNRTVVEKDALRDLQKSEIERQIQMRQNAWSDRLTQLRKELDDQRAASETERTALMQEHHRKLMEVTEDCKTQVIQARRQRADAELAAVEKSDRMAHDLKEALHARDAAEAQLSHQTEFLTVKLSQAQEDGGRELEKVARQEKHRFERQQMEFEKTLRQRDEDFAHRLQQREQELALAYDARMAEDKAKIEQTARTREAELERQFEDRARDVDARWKQEVQQREEAGQIRLKQREQQLQAQAEARLRDLQAEAEEQLRRRGAESERQLDAQTREADTRFKQELQQKEIGFQAKLKQREQELALKADGRETELQKQWAADLRLREEEWERQAQTRIRATEARLSQEAQQMEEAFLTKSRQRDEQWQAKLENAVAELQAQAVAIEPLKAQLERTERERDEAKQIASESARQAQSMEKKLTEASTFLNGWRNGKKLVGTP